MLSLVEEMMVRSKHLRLLSQYSMPKQLYPSVFVAVPPLWIETFFSSLSFLVSGCKYILCLSKCFVDDELLSGRNQVQASKWSPSHRFKPLVCHWGWAVLCTAALYWLADCCCHPARICAVILTVNCVMWPWSQKREGPSEGKREESCFGSRGSGWREAETEGLLVSEQGHSSVPTTRLDAAWRSRFGAGTGIEVKDFLYYTKILPSYL